MDKTNRKWGLIAILLIGLGFMAGRWTMQPIEKIEYIKGDTIHDTIKTPVPHLIKMPLSPDLPKVPYLVFIPGVGGTLIQQVDTAQIIQDYIKRNYYREVLFDNDTIGSLIVEPIVQYNKLQSLAYSFTPVTKTITRERRKVLTPFISTSVNTFGYFGFGGGTYYNNMGFELKYLTDFQIKGAELGVHFKF